MYLLCFILLFLAYFFYIFLFYWNNYGGYIQVALLFKYHQYIIIAPVVTPRNFLCIFLVLQFYFFYILRSYWSNYGGYTQVVSFFKYRQCLIILPSVRTRIYAFGAPASCLRIRCTNYLFTKLWLIRGDALVYRPRSLLQYKRQSPPSQRAYDTTRISCPGI